MSEPLLLLAIFLSILCALIFTRWPPVWVFVVGLLANYFLGYVESSEIFAALVNPGLICLVLILLISVGIERLDWLKRLSSSLIDKSYGLSLFRLGVITAAFSALINNTAVVAALSQTVKRNIYQRPSRLLIPLSYMAILGGTITLVGTSTNLIVSSFMEAATGRGLGLFDFFEIGVVATFFCFLTLLISARVLPENDDASRITSEYLIEMRVQNGSSLVGNTILENKLRALPGLYLVEVSRSNRLLTPVSPNEIVLANDVLIFSGDISSLAALRQFDGLEPFAGGEDVMREAMVEAVVTPNAPIIGGTLKTLGFRSLFDAAVVGLRRGGKRLSGKLGEISLQAGDNLMLAVGSDFFDRKNTAKNFFLMEDIAIPKSLGRVRGLVFTGFLVGVFLLVALGVVPLLKGLITLLLVMVVLGIVTAGELRRRFPFEVWLLIGSALVLSQGLQNTGLIESLSDFLYINFSQAGVYPSLVGVYLATVLLTESMTNNAAAAIAFPLGYGLGHSFGVDPMPFVMAVAYGASASFMTPYGYTTNLLVQNLGGYKFSDYTKSGFPILIVYSTVVLLMLPKVFPF